MSEELTVSEHGEIMEFNPDSFSGNVFEFRANCKVGMVFLGGSERPLSVANKDGRHEFDFTFVMFRRLRQPANGFLVSKKYHKIDEWGQVIGIDSNGMVFSSLIKVYALSSFEELLADFMYDKGTGKETGTLAGKQIRLGFGDKVKNNEGDFYIPKFSILKEDSKFAGKALEVLEQNGAFDFPRVPVALTKTA